MTLRLACLIVLLAAAPALGGEVTYQWTIATGPVANYDVLVSRDGGPFTVFASTVGPVPQCKVTGVHGESLIVKVAARNGTQIGPQSLPSDPHTIVEPLGQPGKPAVVTVP